MKRVFEKIGSGMLIGIGILIIFGFGYYMVSARSGLTASPGDKLTATQRNNLVSQINTLSGQVVSASSTPSGAVLAFNLSNCPSGRKPADGTNGTPDLRGEFIRGLDNGRGVDSGRTLGSFQSGTQLPRVFIGYSEPYMTRTDQPNNIYNIPLDYESITTISSQIRLVPIANTTTCCSGSRPNSFRVRPRNVALLYCVKN